MRGFNKIIIAGNLTRDPEMRTTPSGAQVCRISLAVNRSYRGSDGNQVEQTSFFDCSAWGKVAEIFAQYLHKGDPLLVSGRMDQRSWEDQQTHQKRYAFEVSVEDFNFLSGGKGNDGGNYSAPAPAASEEVTPTEIPSDEEIDVSEIPF